MSYWRDEDFQERLLLFVCRDRNFLKKTSAVLSERDFKPRKGEGSQEAYCIAQLAFKYWHDYREPIGGMLRTEVQDYIRENSRKIGQKSKDKMLLMVDKIKRAEGLVAVEAIERKVAEYKARQAKRRAVHDLIALQEKGELTDRKFREICRDGLARYEHIVKVSNYSEEKELERRIKRRKKNEHRSYPNLHIDPLDRAIRTFPKGNIGIGLAKYGTGKSTFSVHLDQAYAMQGHNVLHFTLEDPVEDVEDKLDASFTGIRLRSLSDKSDKLRRRLKRSLAMLRANIRIVDGTDGGMTVGRMEEIWENYRNQGFDAEAVIVDYDEGIDPTVHYKESGGERRESMEIYKELKQFAARRDLWMWVMAQTQRGKKGQRQIIVTGDDAAIDISKIKRTAMGIGIGDGWEEWGENGRYLYNFKHRYDSPKKGWPIMGDFKKGIFFDKEATDEAMARFAKPKS